MLVGEKAIQVVVCSEGGFIPKPELVIIATASIPSRDQVAPETVRRMAGEWDRQPGDTAVKPSSRGREPGRKFEKISALGDSVWSPSLNARDYGSFCALE